MAISDSREYRAIAAHYGERTARRSGVRLMKHIDDGLAILVAIGAGEAAQRAFCLHPLVQQDADLARAYPRIPELSGDPRVLVLVMEYRKTANAALSNGVYASAADIAVSPLAEVNQMLVADKVQNRADFIAHHRGRHPRSAEIDRYFSLWLERLGIDETRYAELVTAST